MSRLYLRIYLTVLGSLLVFAMLAGLAAFVFSVFDDRPGRDWPERAVAIAERMLPASRSPAALKSELAFWHKRTGFSLMLQSAQGNTIAKAGSFPPDFEDKLHRHSEDRYVWRRGGPFVLSLSDGRQLVAIWPRRGAHTIRHLGWLAALLGIALAVGIAAYPLIRYLARRLERLEKGVAAFGAGDLTARVDIKGRDEIARLAKTFNASADRIEALLQSHKSLLAHASHELRSPLSRLRMAVERLQTGELEQPAHVEIARNIEELDLLVDEILLASRLQANAEEALKTESIDLVGLLAEECVPYKAELEVKGTMTVTITGDQRLLRRLFRNLLENAARYGGDEPANVIVKANRKDVLVSVCDRGPGIAKAEQEKIFEPFYRLKSHPESSGGVGLGLALVRQIAEKHGGAARCVSRPGGGSCFEVSLPATQASAQPAN